VTVRAVTAADGRTLAVREAGDPDGVPVFTLHGTPGSNLIYPPYARDAEERGIRLIAYDRPGYGASTRHEGRTIADSARDLETIADALGLERVCVWGISGGGAPALAAAALLPDRVAAAAALAAVAPYGADGLDYFEGMGELNVVGARLLLAGDHDAYLAMLEEGRVMMLNGSPEDALEFMSSLISDVDREALTLENVEFTMKMTRAGVETGVGGWFDDEIATTVAPWGFDLSSIRVPVLYWHGEQDRFVPFGHGVWLADRIPGVEARLTPDDGHITLSEYRITDVHAWLAERF
jgi:pimeloyl-ACP methyl ester carboxylesterase